MKRSRGHGVVVRTDSMAWAGPENNISVGKIWVLTRKSLWKFTSETRGQRPNHLRLMSVSETISLLQGCPMSRGCFGKLQWGHLCGHWDGVPGSHYLPAHLMGPPLYPIPASSKCPLASAAQPERAEAERVGESPVLRSDVSCDGTRSRLTHRLDSAEPSPAFSVC